MRVSTIFRTFTLGAVCTLSSVAEPSAENWAYHGGDFANLHYAPLDQITRENFKDVSIAWRWTSIEADVIAENEDIFSNPFKTTPLVVDGVMYLSTSFCQVVALNAATGEQLWSFDPRSYEDGIIVGFGYQHRGVSYWSDGTDARIFLAAHNRKLWALDAKSGQPCEGFGEDGVVDLEHSLGRKINPRTISHYSPPGICGDSVIVGSVVGDAAFLRTSTPGHVRAYDARTGEMKWIFHTVPQEGEFGTDTWGDESWRYSGHSNVWGIISSDEQLNHVYLPVSAPSNDLYGGHRPGDNLFSQSIVCLDADSGERVWHFQVVHHGLWDYDLTSAPILADVVVDGTPRKILAQVSKQAFTYVLDRITGEPIWPIEERPVPQSDIPGEKTSPTQPFPTKPLPFDRQGFSDDDIIDVHPVLHEMIEQQLRRFKKGPIYTPPSEEGTIALPGAGGAVSWAGVAFDPATGVLFVPSVTKVGVYAVAKADPNRSQVDYSGNYFVIADNEANFINGIPVIKPPYSRVTAIDLNTGDHLWMTADGDGPIDHPWLKDLVKEPMGAYGADRAPLVTKTLLLVTQGHPRFGSEADKQPRLSVFDKTTGELLGRIPLPADPFGLPISYLSDGKQYIAVAVGGGREFGMGPGKHSAEIVALSL